MDPFFVEQAAPSFVVCDPGCVEGKLANQQRWEVYAEYWENRLCLGCKIRCYMQVSRFALRGISL